MCCLIHRLSEIFALVTEEFMSFAFAFAFAFAFNVNLSQQKLNPAHIIKENAIITKFDTELVQDDMCHILHLHRSHRLK